MKPMEGYIKVKIDRAATSSTIILPDVSVPRSDRGEVVELGPCMRTPSGVAVDFPVNVYDRILFPPYAVEYTYKVDGCEYGIMRAADVVAIL
jgi:co-chaperonin GroES (HSP10)